MKMPNSKELGVLTLADCLGKLKRAEQKAPTIAFPQTFSEPPKPQPLTQAQQNALQYINNQLHALNASLLEINTLNAQTRLGLMPINIEQARAQLGWLVSQVEAAEFRHQHAMSQIQKH